MSIRKLVQIKNLFVLLLELKMKKKIIFIITIIIFCFLVSIIKFDYSDSEFYDKTFVDTSHENSNVSIRYPQINAGN